MSFFLFFFFLVEEAIVALGFGDYYGMNRVIEKSLPYLLSKNLPEDLLVQGLVLADRIPNNAQILVHISKKTLIAHGISGMGI